MEVEKQVSNKELSKQLKDLGVEQNSHFYWVKNKRNEWIISTETNWMNNPYAEWYSAFTVAELGNEFYFTIKDGNEWKCKNTINRDIKFADTEADARAKMKIHIIVIN